MSPGRHRIKTAQRDFNVIHDSNSFIRVFSFPTWKFLAVLSILNRFAKHILPNVHKQVNIWRDSHAKLTILVEVLHTSFLFLPIWLAEWKSHAGSKVVWGVLFCFFL